jgi:hypothetical protein
MVKRILLVVGLACLGLGLLLIGCAGPGGETAPAGPTGPFKISGTVTFPETVQNDGTEYGVFVDTDHDPANGYVCVCEDNCDSGTDQIQYEIADVPEGTYCIYAFVDVDRSGGGPNKGDYLGFCGLDPVSGKICEKDFPPADMKVDAAHLIHSFTAGVWEWSEFGTVNGTIILPGPL